MKNFSHCKLKSLTIRELAQIFLTARLKIVIVRELAYDKLFIYCWRIYHAVRDFKVMVRKIFTVPVIRIPLNDRYREMNETANPILFEF
jgi:predicted SprT family Zn-dependent metalloprotease